MHSIDFSNPIVIIILAVAAIALVAGIVMAAEAHKRKAARLRMQFGSEYERALIENGSERKAHMHLMEREARVRNLRLTDLSVAQRERFMAEWNAIQSRFLDHPRSALTDADELVTTILQTRGYAAANFDQNIESVSVDFPHLIDDFRAAHEVSARSTRGEASTEDLRNAMIQYRSLFDELVKPGSLVMHRSVA
jgi:hypothetical protein